MKTSLLGGSGIRVSRICLGTMTFGQQNTPADAQRQLDAALEAGVNFIDSAEMYPFPANAETFGRSEAIIGEWLKARGNRHRVVLATKVTGPGERFDYIRGGDLKHDRRHLEAALEGSLRRLGTDYVDLYQIHWPDRNANYFGRLDYRHHAEDTFTPLEETLGVLGDLVAAGKVRAVGLSNETPWGVMTYLRLADSLGLPRVVAVQNPYNLLNRSFEIGLSEVALREDCGLLAYSPLAAGTLSGKYLGGARPPGARLSLFGQFDRYLGESALAATRAYVELAREHGLDPTRMAIADVVSQPFVTSAIIGATTMEQLESNLAAADTVLPAEVVEAIATIHRAAPNPAP